MSGFAFHIVKQISVDLANEPGRLAALIEALAEAQILILGISVESGHSVSRIHFVVDNSPDEAVRVLAKLGENVSMEDVLAITILERKGVELMRITRVLADANINIETIYLTSAAEGTKPTVYISATRVPAEEVMKLLQVALEEK
jgi:hypothetical protein